MTIALLKPSICVDPRGVSGIGAPFILGRATDKACFKSYVRLRYHFIFASWERLIFQLQTPTRIQRIPQPITEQIKP